MPARGPRPGDFCAGRSGRQSTHRRTAGRASGGTHALTRRHRAPPPSWKCPHPGNLTIPHDFFQLNSLRRKSDRRLPGMVSALRSCSRRSRSGHFVIAGQRKWFRAVPKRFTRECHGKHHATGGVGRSVEPDRAERAPSRLRGSARVATRLGRLVGRRRHRLIPLATTPAVSPAPGTSCSGCRRISRSRPPSPNSSRVRGRRHVLRLADLFLADPATTDLFLRAAVCVRIRPGSRAARSAWRVQTHG